MSKLDALMRLSFAIYFFIAFISFIASGNNSPHCIDTIEDCLFVEEIASPKPVSDTFVRLAIVSGHIGGLPTYIPYAPITVGDCYFITNNEELANGAKDIGWTSLLLLDIPLLDSEISVEYLLLNSRYSKPLKVFPQRYLPKDYDFIVWFDNKFEILVGDVLKTISAWNPFVAVMMHKRPREEQGADYEFKEAMQQSRYQIQKEAIEKYINEESALGYPVRGERHLQTGFIIYNMRHAETHSIQHIWSQHIDRVGIACQIAFYFVAQRFPESVQEYLPDWQNGRITIFREWPS